MMVSRICTALFLAISSTAVAAEPIQSVWPSSSLKLPIQPLLTVAVFWSFASAEDPREDASETDGSESDSDSNAVEFSETDASETDASETDASESDSDSNAVEFSETDASETDASETDASESDSDSNAIEDGSETDGSETDGSESDSDSNAVSAEDFIKAAMQAAGAAAGTECATAHCALESAACAEDADCSKPLYAGDFAALARLETNSAAAAAFTCLTGNDYTDCLNGKLEEAGGVAQATYTAAVVAAGTTCAGTICLDAVGACVAEQGCATILNTGVYRNLATVETAAGRAALACFTSYYYLTCFETTTAKNLGLEEEEEEEEDEEGSESESEEANPCDSEEASECAEYCLSCGQACTKDDGVTLDVSSESCLEATIPLGSWDCTEGTCGCLANCLKCVAYQECLPSDSDGENTDSEDALFADAARAAAVAMGLNAEQVSAFAAIVEGLPENSPLEKMVADAVLAAFGETAPSIDALTATMKTVFTSAAFSTTLGNTEGVDAGVLAAVNTASENANESGAAGLALNFAVVAMAAAALF